MEVDYSIACLEKTPVILNALLNQIPENRYKVRRLKNKWSIHEQVCHLVEAQYILIERFALFEKEKNPTIESHNPLNEKPEDYYLKMNFAEQLKKFPTLRLELIDILKNVEPAYWEYQGKHASFSPYNTRILLTHTLNIDYAHLFSIEQLGLTKAGFEDEIMTIP